MLTAQPSGTGRLRITWQEPVVPNGVILYYDIVYQAVGNASNLFPDSCRSMLTGNRNVNGTTRPLELELDQLCFFTRYIISVSAVNGGGGKSNSTNDSVLTNQEGESTRVLT